MTSFTLWINHYHQLGKKGYHKMAVGVTEEAIHVKFCEQEVYLTMQEIVDYVLKNGNEVEDEEDAEI